MRQTTGSGPSSQGRRSRHTFLFPKSSLPLPTRRLRRQVFDLLVSGEGVGETWCQRVNRIIGLREIFPAKLLHELRERDTLRAPPVSRVQFGRTRHRVEGLGRDGPRREEKGDREM